MAIAAENQRDIHAQLETERENRTQITHIETHSTGVGGWEVVGKRSNVGTFPVEELYYGGPLSLIRSQTFFQYPANQKNNAHWKEKS